MIYVREWETDGNDRRVDEFRRELDQKTALRRILAHFEQGWRVERLNPQGVQLFGLVNGARGSHISASSADSADIETMGTIVLTAALYAVMHDHHVSGTDPRVEISLMGKGELLQSVFNDKRWMQGSQHFIGAALGFALGMQPNEVADLMTLSSSDILDIFELARDQKTSPSEIAREYKFL